MPELRYALTYTKPNGLRPSWAVFPLRGKIPAVSREKGGHGCLDATADQDIIAAWWKEYPNANIGLATGEKNGILVIDIDRNHGDGTDGEETLLDLIEKFGPLPPTVEALTPNGGRHLYFRYPQGYDIGIHKAPSGGQWPGIDIRGNGGYVAAPPSAIVCADGKTRAYEWEVCGYPSEMPLAELPPAWLEWVNGLCGRFVPPDPGSVKKGARNDTLFSYACKLRAGGADEQTLAEKLTEYNRRLPDPLPEREVLSICKSAARYPEGAPPDGVRKSKPRLTREKLAETVTALGYGIRYNLITCRYEITGRSPAGRAMGQDDLITLLYDTLADEYRGCNFDTLQQFVTFLARENSYDPVLDLMKATPWDGKDRFGQLYTLMGIMNDPLSKALTRKWMYQSVALLFNSPEDPYGADGCLVLNGPQGTGKTSLFRHLALKDEWFGEGCSIDDHDKDTSRRVVTKWIAELGEVESTLKSDISKLKAFITAAMDAYRLPYARSDTAAPRHTSLCATCNSDRYLIDPTGNRRWWSVPFVRHVPREELLKLDALQLWAQVYAAVAPMSAKERSACYRLTGEEQAALEERNAGFEKTVRGQEEVADILEMAEYGHLTMRKMTITEFKDRWDVLRPYSASQIGIALKKCGVEIIHSRKGNLAVLPKPGPCMPF